MAAEFSDIAAAEARCMSVMTKLEGRVDSNLIALQKNGNDIVALQGNVSTLQVVQKHHEAEIKSSLVKLAELDTEITASTVRIHGRIDGLREVLGVDCSKTLEETERRVQRGLDAARIMSEEAKSHVDTALVPVRQHATGLEKLFLQKSEKIETNIGILDKTVHQWINRAMGAVMVAGVLFGGVQTLIKFAVDEMKEKDNEQIKAIRVLEKKQSDLEFQLNRVSESVNRPAGGGVFVVPSGKP